MNKWMELLLGLILVTVPIVGALYSQNWGIWNFWTAAGEFYKGGLFWFVVMIGVLFILLGISDLKEPSVTPRPQQAPQMPPAQAVPAAKRAKK